MFKCKTTILNFTDTPALFRTFKNNLTSLIQAHLCSQRFLLFCTPSGYLYSICISCEIFTEEGKRFNRTSLDRKL